MLETRVLALAFTAALGSLLAAGCTLGGGAENDSPHDDATSTAPDVRTVETAPAWVLSACSGLGYIDIDHVLAAAYETNAGLVALWEGLQAGLAGVSSLSPFNAYPPGHPVAVCYVAGFFAAPGGPPPLDGSTKPPYERAIIAIPQGALEPLPLAFGPATMTVTDGPPAVGAVQP